MLAPMGAKVHDERGHVGIGDGHVAGGFSLGGNVEDCGCDCSKQYNHNVVSNSRVRVTTGIKRLLLWRWRMIKRSSMRWLGP